MLIVIKSIKVMNSRKDRGLLQSQDFKEKFQLNVVCDSELGPLVTKGISEAISEI
jgi:hypothetical protein